MDDRKRQRSAEAFKAAANYVYWRERMGLCQKRCLSSCCGKCQRRVKCNTHRSYAEADNVLSFINRQPK